MDEQTRVLIEVRLERARKETAEKVVSDAEKFISCLAQYLQIQFGLDN